MSTPLRSFVAIPICPDSAPDAYGFLLDRRERFLSGSWSRRVRWVKPEHYHLTLEFLGPIAIEESAVWGPKLDESLINITSFSLIINAPRLFPRVSRAKIVACPVEHAPELKRLRRTVQSVFAPLSGNDTTQAKHAPYRAHVTLGRIRRTNTKGKAPNLPSIPGSVTLQVREVDVMASFPCVEGVRHEIVHRIAL